MNISVRIRKARKNAGLTIKELSELINVPVQTISNYERKERTVSIGYIEKLCTHLNINANWLVKGFGEMYSCINDDFFTKEKSSSEKDNSDQEHPQDQGGSEHLDLMPFNEVLLEKINNLVEKRLKNTGRELKSEKKFKIVLLVYQYILKSKSSLTNKIVDDYIELAA